MVAAGGDDTLQSVAQATSLGVHVRHRDEPVVLDGEITAVETPLKFSMSPAPLRVIVPPAELKEEAGQMFITRR